METLPYGLKELRLKRRNDVTAGAAFSEYRPWGVKEFYGSSRSVIEGFARQLHNSSVQKVNRMFHFHLLHGPPGTGKTSIAFALSKMLNCLNPIHENGMQLACDECSSCKSIESRVMNGKHGAVVYLDGNSVGKDGVQDVIKNTLSRSSNLDGKNTILILEEAQALTPASLSSLLAPGENLNKKHYIIMISSEPEKILKNDALASRMNRVAIRAWSVPQIIELLKDVAVQEHQAGICPVVPEEVLEKIAENCGENPREAIKLLQSEVIVGGARNAEGGYDIAELTKQVLSGAPDRKLIVDFAKAILNGKIVDATDILYDRVLKPKIDLNPFVYRVMHEMRYSFNRVRIANKNVHKLSSSDLLNIMRGIVVFGDKFYSHRIINGDNAIAMATMEALEHTSRRGV